jgi:hypothetical protein
MAGESSGDSVLAALWFEEALRYVHHAGLEAELNWQISRRDHEFGEEDLLRETAWVILCSGFRESVVRTLFNNISLSFCDWESARTIMRSAPLCRASALLCFNYPRKIDAIVSVARIVNAIGFLKVKRKIRERPLQELQRFPYIGPVTACHLAKNLGFQVVKPDRHLLRLSAHLGYESPHQLCSTVSALTGQPISVVDLIFWRYLADGPHREGRAGVIDARPVASAQIRKMAP